MGYKHNDACLEKALCWERLFVLLERDPVAPDVIRFWCERRVEMGLNSRDDPKITEALEQARLMAECQEEVRDYLREMRA